MSRLSIFKSPSSNNLANSSEEEKLLDFPEGFAILENLSKQSLQEAKPIATKCLFFLNEQKSIDKNNFVNTLLCEIQGLRNELTATFEFGEEGDQNAKMVLVLPYIFQEICKEYKVSDQKIKSITHSYDAAIEPENAVLLPRICKEMQITNLHKVIDSLKRKNSKRDSSPEIKFCF